MRRLLALLAFLGAGTPLPAVALSCMPYGAVDAYHDAAAAADSYVVVVGRLSFDAANLPQTDWEHQEDTPQDTVFDGRLTGQSLTRDGFTAPFDRDIRINVQCFGPWCAGLAPNRDYLVFLKKTGSGYLLETDPCGGFAFPDPTAEMRAQVLSCFRGGRCVSEWQE